jgi:hypothetical protein
VRNPTVDTDLSIYTPVINAGPVLDSLLAMVDRPGYGRHGREKAREHAARYAAGLPLVAFGRKLNQQWRWVCPVPDCLVLRDGFATIRACRDAWRTHVSQGSAHEGFTPSWPDDLEPEPEPLTLFDLADAITRPYDASIGGGSR